MPCCCSRRRGRWAGSDCALCWASASRRECGIERGMPELRVSLCHAVGAKQALESDLGCGAEARAQAAVRAEMAKVREPAFRSSGLEQESGLAVHHDLAGAAERRGNDRHAGFCGLEQNCGEWVERGRAMHDDVDVAEDPLARLRALEPHSASELGSEPGGGVRERRRRLAKEQPAHLFGPVSSRPRLDDLEPLPGGVHAEEPDDKLVTVPLTLPSPQAARAIRDDARPAREPGGSPGGLQRGAWERDRVLEVRGDPAQALAERGVRWGVRMIVE